MLRLVIGIWLRPMMYSFFGIGEGPSSSEYNQYGAVGNIGNFATSTGESDISTASDFWRSIISGDPNQLSRVLGPEYSNISKRGQQELKTLSEFGTRSGGTAAQQQQIGETERAESTALEGGVLETAADRLGSMGTGLLSTGLSAHEAAFSEANTIQQQKQAKLNDIFKSIMSVAAAIPTGGFSLAGFAGGGGATATPQTGAGTGVEYS